MSTRLADLDVPEVDARIAADVAEAPPLPDDVADLVRRLNRTIRTPHREAA